MLTNKSIYLVATSINKLGALASRPLHSSPVALAGARYRESKSEERHFNRHRILADTPDWSYLDGRPAPMLMRQRKRYFQQIEYNETIQRMLYEVNTAKEKEAERLADMKEQKQQIIANKLKPKGIALNAGSLRFNKKRHVYSAPAFS